MSKAEEYLNELEATSPSHVTLEHREALKAAFEAGRESFREDALGLIEDIKASYDPISDATISCLKDALG